jgi:hypothetical protein
MFGVMWFLNSTMKWKEYDNDASIIFIMVLKNKCMLAFKCHVDLALKDYLKGEVFLFFLKKQSWAQPLLLSIEFVHRMCLLLGLS